MQAVSLSTLIWGVIAAGGGGAVVAAGIFRAFGERWLNSRFEERLQKLRHQHERQMEDVRLEASRVLDHSARLSQKEFEVSAEAWSLVFEAYVQVMGALPGFRRHPDLSRATDKVARRIAMAADFDELEIDELLKEPAAQRNAYYAQRIEVHEIWSAKKAVRAANNYLEKNALFIERDVHERLTQFVDQAWQAIVDWDVIREMRGEPIPEGLKRRDEEFRKVGEQQINELKAFVRQRFWERRQVMPEA